MSKYQGIDSKVLEVVKLFGYKKRSEQCLTKPSFWAGIDYNPIKESSEMNTVNYSVNT